MHYLFDDVNITPCTPQHTSSVLPNNFSQGRSGRSSVFVPYLIYMWVPVLVVLGLGCRAVDSGEEGGLGEVH